MANITIKIDGLQQLMAKSEAVNRSVRSVLGPAVKAGADIIQDDAQRRAREKSGDLKKGIVSRITWDKNASKAFAGCGMDPAMNDVFVKYTKDGKRYYYPASIEFGTRHAPAYPFMRPALDDNRARIKAVVADHIRRAVEGAT